MPAFKAFKKKLEPQGTAASSECRGILQRAAHTHGCAHTTFGDPAPACPKAMDPALQEGSDLMCSSIREADEFSYLIILTVLVFDPILCCPLSLHT